MNRTPRLDLNPSSADRWTTCTASPHFILENWDKLPPDGSRYAEEGTTAHEVAASMLQNRAVRLTECPTEINSAMRSHAFDYADYVSSLREPGNKMVVETKFPLWYMPERNALVDVAILNPANAHIVDLKYGEGIIVSPVENLQGAIYARSVLPRIWAKQVPDSFPITIHIYQPRGRDMTQPHHTWETTWGELVDFTSERVEKPSRTVLNPKSSIVAWGQLVEGKLRTQFAPSDKACQWCPAKGFCAARQQSFTTDFEDLTLMEPKALPLATTLSQEQLVLVQTHGDDIIKWVKDVQDYIQERMKAGHALPGFKLVMSRGGNRYWTDPKKAALMLFAQTILKREEVIEEKTISPAAVEKLLGKNKLTADLMNLIGKPPGSPVIAPEDDKREAITDVTSDFTPISGE